VTPEPALEDDEEPLELTDLLPPEPTREEAFAPLTFTAAPAPDMADLADTELPAPMAADAVMQPQEPAQHEQGEPLPVMMEEDRPQPEAASAEEQQPSAPAAAANDAQATEIYDEIFTAPAITPVAPETEHPAEQPAELPDTTEFMASAGLEGPLWAAETGAEDIAAAPAMTETPPPATDETPAAESVQEPAQETTPSTAVATAAETEQPEAPLDATPTANAEPDSAPANAPQTPDAAPAAPAEPDLAAQETIAWPNLAEAMPVAAEPRAQERPEQPEQAPAPQPHDVAPVEPASNTLKTLTDRVGEATLTPVNSANATTSDTADFDVPAPAGKGAWDAYSLHDEWVGEPMPIGTPVASRPAASKPSVAASPAAVAPLAAQRPAAPEARDKKHYVSPSLSHPGEWVGEPMPMTKPAKADNVPEQQSQGAQPAQAEEPHARQAEMPRTATGRLILKLLGNSGDRPLHAEDQPDDSPLPAAQTDLLLPQAEAPVQPAAEEQHSPANAAAGEEPRRAVTLRKGASGGNSIMNFIAGAAEALRGAAHEKAPQPNMESPHAAAMPAAPTPKTAEPAPFKPAAAPTATEYAPAPAALVPPTAPRETDQTIPQLVARLDAAMDDAQKGFKSRRCAVVGEAAGRIASESDEFGFRVLARMARCVERAAKANDMNALRDLLPELAVAVERNRIGLTPSR